MLDARVSYPENEPQTFLARARDVRARFAASGTSIAEWARQNSVSERLVHAVLSGDRACLRGKSHKIAVALGLKESAPAPGEPVSVPAATLEDVRR